ncbi:hypothetical protein K788_0006061 (plasmid) [Paraburkholderia caribensis MBA4]|uniref:Uncharacterized protein n=1 Tax=Paraburkholderia caribensis MBA4 TaxID=1323664 RepID=A0A0P0RR45_9BURK|nr:hypothetical protein K788_0006061 [Paraburkholderia caribensis MBA4]
MPMLASKGAVAAAFLPDDATCRCVVLQERPPFLPSRYIRAAMLF